MDDRWAPLENATRETGLRGERRNSFFVYAQGKRQALVVGGSCWKRKEDKGSKATDFVQSLRVSKGGGGRQSPRRGSRVPRTNMGNVEFDPASEKTGPLRPGTA